MFKILIAAVAAVLLIFILSLGGIQSQREADYQPYLAKVIDTVIQSSPEQTIPLLHPEYASETSKDENEKWLAAMKQDLAALGTLVKIEPPVFSYKSAARPVKGETQSNVFIIRAKFAQGDVLLRIGVVVEDKDAYYVDRLYVSSSAILDEAGRQKRYSLIVNCSEEKNIDTRPIAAAIAWQYLMAV